MQYPAATERREQAGRAKRSQPRVSLLALLLGLLSLVAVVAPPLEAQQDRSALIRSLRSSRDFRVRVQVAFALGNTRDPAVRQPLERALRDENPAVRAAAATALGRLGSRRALRALRRAQRDSAASVRVQAERSIATITGASSMQAAPMIATPRRGSAAGVFPNVAVVPQANSISWPRVRYVVVLGRMANRSSFRGGDALAARMRNEVHRNLSVLRGVAVFQNDDALDRRATQQIRRRRLPKLHIEGNLTDVTPQRRRSELSVRCAVSLMLLANGDLRGAMSGAATGSETQRGGGEQEQRLAQQALSAAIRSAMSQAPSALQRAARR